MNWLLVALVTYTNSASPDLKIHAGLRFATFDTCKNYRKANDELLNKQLLERYPNIEKTLIRCFHTESIKEMRRRMYQDN